MLLHAPGIDALFHHGRRLDPWRRIWQPAAVPPNAVPIDAVAAVRWLHTRPDCRRLPVAVIGPRNADRHRLDVAEELGTALGRLGLVVLTGGKGGVMEAVSKAANAAGGFTVGLVPDEDWRSANDYVALPLATGLGPVRNALIARAALALVAVGGEYGTLSEIAFGLHFDKPVLTLADAPVVPGAIVCADVAEVIARLAPVLLHLEP